MTEYIMPDRQAALTWHQIMYH